MWKSFGGGDVDSVGWSVGRRGEREEERGGGRNGGKTEGDLYLCALFDLSVFVCAWEIVE